VSDKLLIYEKSVPGRIGYTLPNLTTSEKEVLSQIPAKYLRQSEAALPEATEGEVMRHFVGLSVKNHHIDKGFYPLGSCTMKYNPKRNERAGSDAGLVDLHPYQPDETVQGLLELLYRLQEMLAAISGLPAVSLQPAAGAHGELTALMIAAAFFRDHGDPRRKVMTPDSAHGTNPASAAMAGFDVVPLKSTSEGYVDMDDLRAKLDDQVAVLMLTNPNTLGMFDRQVCEVAAQVHHHGGLVYLDGANMNAILGIARPGDFGADMMHFNPHKTFSGPHGGGGPGAGPICVRSDLAPYLPVPQITAHEGGYRLDDERPKSIGRVRSFFGNVGVLIRAYAYLRTHGPDGLRRVAENAVLNANYLLSQVQDFLPVPQGNRCMHEFVASAAALKRDHGVTAMDLAKRLLDFGFHAPTVYFPLTVREAIMIEPTETESKETLDAFAQALAQIVTEPGQSLHDAPQNTPVSRPDEVQAARQPVLVWSPVEGTS
jgi:glycine dehydrogenase subunit 2